MSTPESNMKNESLKVRDDERLRKMLTESLRATLAKKNTMADERSPMNEQYYRAVEKILNQKER